MKKFNDYRNIIGTLVKEHREQKNYTKTELSHKLELLGIELDRFELYKIETAKKSVKDFELVALCMILDINMNELKKQAIYVDKKPIDEYLPDPDDAVFYEIVMEARKDVDAYLVTGNLKHFPEKAFVVTPKEMMDIISKEK
mgnify:CR=1 FL=1